MRIIDLTARAVVPRLADPGYHRTRFTAWAVITCVKVTILTALITADLPPIAVALMAALTGVGAWQTTRHGLLWRAALRRRRTRHQHHDDSRWR